MGNDLKTAFVIGYERMAAWSDLLDEINVFPLADADTGRNLRISLAPLIFAGNGDGFGQQLLMAAKGNSGNIAAAFFSKFATIETPNHLCNAAEDGKNAAWRALADPRPGTMLSVFDTLTESLAELPSRLSPRLAADIIDRLKNTVLDTTEKLPELRQAGVVDAGALGMFIFFEGFLKRLTRDQSTFCSPPTVFSGRLKISRTLNTARTDDYCIDTLIRTSADPEDAAEKIVALGSSVVAVPDHNHLKVHLHAPGGKETRQRLESLGTVVEWRQEKIEHRGPRLQASDESVSEVHIVTDAAGSLSRATAEKLDISLLESYILIGDRSLPETLVPPDELYSAMRRKLKVSTAQASVFERHQCYESLLSRYPHVVYLCVGSVFTGNFHIARQWKAENDPDDRMAVIDTTAASGRLGLMAMDVARFAGKARSMPGVVQYAEAAINRCEELIFLDRLKYLAAGGRISRAGGFFGDLLNAKPVISPTAQGAKKVAVVRTRDDQVQFALDYMDHRFSTGMPKDIMLEYTDNRDWTISNVKPRFEERFPMSSLILQPMSLTSGAHMGPGTWAVAFSSRTRNHEDD